MGFNRRRLLLFLLTAVLLCAAFLLAIRLFAPVRTLPPDARSDTHLRFFAAGDQGTGSARQWRVARTMADQALRGDPLNFVMLLGDNFYMSGVADEHDSQWKSRFENVYDTRALNVPFYAILGNHDHSGNAAAQIRYGNDGLGSGRWRMPDHHYSVDYGDHDGRPLVRIVFVDTNLPAGEVAHVIDTRMAAEPAPVWRIVAGHHPMRNFGKHGENAALLAQVLPTLQARKVDVYFAGHDHNKQVIAVPGEPIQVISGAAGKTAYPLRRPADDRLVFGSEKSGFFEIDLDAGTLTLTAIGGNGRIEDRRQLSRRCTLAESLCMTALPVADAAP